MSISRLNGSTEKAAPARTKRPPAPASVEPKDTCELNRKGDPVARVDRLISDIQQGKLHYAPEIQSKMRQQELTLSNFPCQKYTLHAGAKPIDTRHLPSEIVADGEKPRYRNAITVDSKLSEKQNAKDLKERGAAIHQHMDELFAQRAESLMVLMEGDNAAGKDGMIKHVFSLNPMTTDGQVAFKAASAEEKTHDPNWRIMKNLAGPGQVMFHNRSAYGDVVFATKTEADKAQRIADIKEMEYGLTMGLPMTAEGHIALPDKVGNVEVSAVQRPPMRFIKVLLGVSKEEQAARLADRLTDDSKVYKVTQADLDGREKHDEIQSSFANAMAAASTPWAPAYFIPNDNKLTGWRKMAQITDEILSDMDPQPPGSKDGMSPSARHKAAQELREIVDAALNKD